MWKLRVQLTGVSSFIYVRLKTSGFKDLYPLSHLHSSVIHFPTTAFIHVKNQAGEMVQLFFQRIWVRISTYTGQLTT